MYLQKYSCPLGQLLLAADDSALVQLRFDAEKQLDSLPKDVAFVETPVLQTTKLWLNIYFSGQEPDFMPPLRPAGTDFQQKVWQLLRQIPYGETTTYGEISRALAAQQGQGRMSAQAVGGAVGRNPIAILIPCHRVIGAHGKLTGYAGGLDKKRFLLSNEHIDLRAFFD